MKNFPKWSLSLFRNSGSIIVFSIWVLVFFSILSLGLYRVTFSKIQLARKLEERLLGCYLAKAAVLYAHQQRIKDETAYDSLYELRQERKRELGKGSFIYTIIDEESRVNINTAPFEVIARLPGLNTELAKGIVNSSFRPFRLKEEVLFIDGIDEKTFDGLKDFITVYSHGKVNINTASPAALKALGLDDELVEIIRGLRAGKDNKEATEDDGVFENTGEIVNKLQGSAAISALQRASLLQLIDQGLISVASEILSLEIETKILDRPAMKYVVVVDNEKIKQWTER